MGEKPPELFGVPIKEIARLCSVSLKTATRWKDGTTCPPETAILVLRLRWHGDLGVLSGEWDGWYYRDGLLVSPDGWRIDRNDALAVPLLHGHIKALQAQVASLEVHNDLEDQPGPEEVQAEISVVLA